MVWRRSTHVRWRTGTPACNANIRTVVRTAWYLDSLERIECVKQLLIHSAKQLTVEDAGGHGDRWSIFQDAVTALIGSWIGTAIQEADIPAFALTDERALEPLIARGESSASALLYTGNSPGASKTGLMSLIHHDAPGLDRKAESRLWSAFPFFGIGLEIEAEVEDLSYIPQVEDTIWREFRWRSGGRNAHPARRVA